VLTDGYVTDESGTGIVHQAPYFGEDDYRVCLAAGVITKGQDMICPVDDSGRFVEPVTDFLNQYVKVCVELSPINAKLYLIFLNFRMRTRTLSKC
jgi:isoleucyl-tRNA synthetase